MAAALKESSWFKVKFLISGEESVKFVQLQLQWDSKEYGVENVHSAYLSAENVDELIDLLVKAKNRVPVWSDEDED